MARKLDELKRRKKRFTRLMILILPRGVRLGTRQGRNNQNPIN